MDFSMKRTIKTLVVTIALLVGSVSVSNAEWTEITENVHGTTFYVDFERIQKNGEYVYFWDLLDRVKPTKHGTLSLISFIEGNCNMFGYRYLQISSYTESMGRGTRSNFDSSPSEWKYASPNSTVEFVLKTVCDW